MSEQMASALLAKLEMLSAEKQKEVVDFVEFLIAKSKEPNGEKVAKFGSSKGKYKMSPDFDEPLEDFKEYME
jgi:hypothetical protein